MKVTVKIKYPVWSFHKEIKEIDIPDGVNVENWLYEHETEILEEHGAEGDMSAPIEMGYAGVKILKEGK